MFNTIMYKNKRMFDNRSSRANIFLLKEKMPYKKLIIDIDLDKFAKEKDIILDKSFLHSGLYTFTKNGEVVAIYDYVTQTLSYNIDNLI